MLFLRAIFDWRFISTREIFQLKFGEGPCLLCHRGALYNSKNPFLEVQLFGRFEDKVLMIWQHLLVMENEIGIIY